MSAHKKPHRLTAYRYIVNLSLCYPLNGITTHFSIYAFG